MSVEYRVVSIGTLSRHPLWDEAAGLRTPHATTTLIRSGGRVILVDPGLPAPALAARLNERSGLTLEQVTDVFLTNFRPAHRAGLAGLDHARWLISEAEREAVGGELLRQFQEAGDDELRDVLRREIALMKRCEAAEDSIAPQVDLFPLPGYTPGCCGLLLARARETVLIASDAVATTEHLERGQVLQGAFDYEWAMESFKEAIEIADVIIPGHDNAAANPRRGMF